MRWFLFFVTIGLALPVRADIWDGLAAYDAGDYAVAREEWRPLAESGDAEAQVALAGLFVQGLGVPFDLQRAARWFRRAADQGHAIAQLNLGDDYARGRGVPLDLAQAWFWLGLAARQGNRWAETRRDAIEKAMDGTALTMAKRRLKRWRPTVE